MENRNNHKNQKTVKTAGAIFSESLKSLMPFFANNEKKGSRVKAHIAAMVAMLLIIGVGNAWGANETVTWSVSTSNANTISKDSGTLPTGASASMSSNDSQSDKSQLIKDKKQTFTLTGMDGCTIKGVTINMRKSNNGSSATVTVKVGSTTLQSGQSISLSTTAADKTVTLANTTTVVGTSENVVITVTAAKSSAYVLKYKVTYEASTKCATPTFSPAAGTYNNNQSVSINCATASATIRYTTNGSDPTESSATYSSPISVSGTTTIKAKAFKAGLTASDIATSTYTMVCATPTFSVAEGTYNNDQSVTLSCETEGAAIHYTIDGSDPTSSSPTYSSALSISSTQTLKAIAIKSGYTNSSIASAAYTMVCSNPTITLTAGTYNNDQSTTITTTTAGATIRYTLDGTTPTESSAVYSSAIAITSSKTLKAKVFKANLDLVKQGLVIFTWGNVSGIDREKGLVVIKPSGVSYDEMKASDMVVVDLESGKVVEGDLNPSSDTPTHLVLYKAFPNIQGVVHTHSTYATAFAQAGRDIPNIGTTHADYFYKDIPCTRDMTKEEVEGQYELETGNVIVDEILNIRKINPDHTPAVLVKNHGPFSWGTSPDNAVYNAKVMEQCAKMAFVSFMVNPATTMNPLLVEKHYMRKHGPNAYYGQKGQKH